MISVLQLKIISTTVLFVMSLLGGIAPYWMKNLKNSARYLSWSNAFGGGVFFGAGMLHLFATADEEMQPYIKKFEYPLAALCLCGGFLFTLFLELFINAMFMNSTIFNELHGHGHSSHHAHEKEKHGVNIQDEQHHHSYINNNISIDNHSNNNNNNNNSNSILVNNIDQNHRVIAIEPDERQKLLGSNDINQNYDGVNGDFIDKGGNTVLPAQIQPAQIINNGRQPKSHNKSLSYRFPQEPSPQQEEDEIIIDYEEEEVFSFIPDSKTRGNGSTENVNRKNSLKKSHHHHYEDNNSVSIVPETINNKPVISKEDKITASKKARNLLLPFLLVIALSIHSLFEGLAMGIQSSEGHVIDILIAIFAHKILASFALGVSTITSADEKPSFLKLFLLILIFSLTSPLGSVIGMVVSSEVAESLAPSILQGIASGTFLYVAVVEVIPKELGHDSEDVLIKSILLFLGFAFMGVVAIWV
ncbi:hypothetical protein DICPUDRAFT_152527 [Dictyostelium purpureum]|uniref:Zinc/iron permease n=1 Tax=Dictyostelium purpureum TaxID=5786 RepID=F0ZLL2_DICPU|nr:uncharacterized protein DICPUDRAFT_152527 [Dictyostelium purpureum]EGC35174.1 hypothetical protein DICPUDRAFT_152527 [Dictyostelium purpureum]|eukprot:XP_003288312.1 hypothetical protein DICPUDRAFT_152527 [Dictyostelium purpureum]